MRSEEARVDRFRYEWGKMFFKELMKLVLKMEESSKEDLTLCPDLRPYFISA